MSISLNLALLMLALAAGFQIKQKAHRHFQSLVMAKTKAKAEGAKLNPFEISTIWARLSGEVGNEVLSVKCNPNSTTIDDLKELIKLKCSSTLRDIDAPKLIVKGSDGNALREGIFLSSRSEGKAKITAFIVEVPKIASNISIVSSLVFNEVSLVPTRIIDSERIDSEQPVDEKTFSDWMKKESFDSDIKYSMKVGNLIAAGVNAHNDTDTLYIREQSKRMMKILDEITVNPIQFQGCPGVGKSTTLFGYLNLPQISKEGYLWIHFTYDICSIIHRKNSGAVFKTVTFDIDPTIHYSFLKSLVRTVSDVAFIILDGVTIDDFQNKLYLTACTRANIKTVSCTSRGAKIFSTEVAALMGCPLMFTVESWKFEEYKEAFKINLPAFKARYKNLEELEKAYFYAGGSMRFMCSEIKYVINILDNKFNAVSDYSLLLRGLQGGQSDGSINTLMQIIDDNSVPLSKYVCRKLARKVDATFISAASNVNVGNPSWQGMVYEMKILNHIQKKAEPLQLFNAIDGLPTSWPTVNGGANQMDFDPPVYTKEYMSGRRRNIKNQINIPRNTWLFPVRYNQGGYDIAFLDAKGVIFFFQVTVANKHDYKFGSLIPSLDLLCSKDGSANINYCVLIPKKNKNTFEIGPSHIKKANLITAYDDGWSWTEPIPQDTLATVTPDIPQVNSGVLDSKKKKKPKKRKYSDYKNTTRISVYLVS